MATVVVSEGPAPARWRPRLPERLPELGGWVLRAYQLVWIVAAVLATASSTFMAYRAQVHDQSLALATYDAGLFPAGSNADGVQVKPFSPQAHAAGIVDDTIVRIDGKAAPLDYDRAAPLLGGPDGSRIALTLRDPGGRIRDVVLTRNRNYLRDAYAGSGINWIVRRWIEFAIGTIASLLGLAVWALLFLRRPRDPVAALLSLGGLLDSITLVQFGGSSLLIPQLALSAVSGTMIFLGILFFPDGRLAPRWWPAAVIVILVMESLQAAFYWNAGIAAFLPFVIIGTVSLCVAAVIGRYRAAPPGVARQQIKFAMLGFVGAVFFALLILVCVEVEPLAPNEGARAWILTLESLFGSMVEVSIAVGLLVALLRFRLYDAETAIGRSAAYGVLTLGFIALFAGAEKLAEIVGERYFEHSIGIIAGAVGAAIAAAVIVPLHNRVHRWAERRFQKPLIRLREGLPELVADLRESAPVEQLVSAVMARVEAGVRSTREAILLADGGKLALAGTLNVAPGAVDEWQGSWNPSQERMLDCDRRDALFPLRVRLCIESASEPETIGWLLLGPRPDGSFFGKDEREALAHVAGPVARAIHIAQLRERREEQAEKRIGALESLVAKMFDGLSSEGARGAAPA